MVEKCTLCRGPLDRITQHAVMDGNGFAHELCHYKSKAGRVDDLEDENRVLLADLKQADEETKSLQDQVWMERQIRWTLEKKLQRQEHPSLIRRAFRLVRRMLP